LNSQIAEHFYHTTKNDSKRHQPKELHRMKAAVINNALLSLIIIEKEICHFVIYNEKAQQFKDQFSHCIDHVQELVGVYGPTIQSYEKMQKIRRERKEKLASGLIKEEDKDVIQASYQQFYSQNLYNQVQPLDLDYLHEHNLKIFGDVFESLIGAIFLDSQSIDVTKEVLHRIMKPYIRVYGDLEMLQDHARTTLLELWNSKPFTRKLRCCHKK